MPERVVARKKLKYLESPGGDGEVEVVKRGEV